MIRRHIRRMIRRAASKAGFHIDNVGKGMFTVRREPWPDRVQLEAVSPHGAVLARQTLRAGERWQRDKWLLDWVGGQRLAELLRRYRVNLVLDVGANTGQYAELLRAIGYQGHIVSFEPVREFYETVAAKAAADGNWTAHNLALGAEDGTAEMHVTPNTLSSMLPASDYGSERFHSLRQTTVQEVPVRRLEHLLDDLVPEKLADPKIFLKMDTQGFDLEVFTGLGARTKDVIGLQSELALLTIYDGMPRMLEALSTYEAAGFEIAGMSPVNQDGRTLRILEYDCLMVRPESGGG